VGSLAAIGALPRDAISGFTVLGELGLDGSIAPVAGVLPAAIGANARACDIQTERYSGMGLPGVRTNAQVSGAALEQMAQADASGMALLRDAADSMHLSARGYHRVLRVARTLADVDGAERVGRVHLAEAPSYRALTDEVRRAA